MQLLPEQWSRRDFSGSALTIRLSSKELRKQLTNWLLLQPYQKKPGLRQIVLRQSEQNTVTDSEIIGLKTPRLWTVSTVSRKHYSPCDTQGIIRPEKTPGVESHWHGVREREQRGEHD